MKDSRVAISRWLLTSALSLSLAVSLAPVAVRAQSVDLSKWSPEYVKSIAGTDEFDTAAECAQGRAARLQGPLTYWYTGPTDAEPEITTKMDKEFWAAWKATYPNIETDVPDHRLQRRCSTSSARRCSATPGRWWCGCRSWAASSSPPRATSRS